MSETSYHTARDEQIIAIRFRMNASSDDVVAHLIEAVRGTDLSLLKVERRWPRGVVWSVTREPLFSQLRDRS